MAMAIEMAQSNTMAQGYFQVGTGPARYDCPNLNRIVYVYNYTRPWLSQKMAYFGTGRGYSMEYGQLRKKLGWNMGFGLFSESHDAFGLEPQSSAIGYRRITYSNYSMFFGIPIRAFKSRFFEINILPTVQYVFYSLQTQYARNPEFLESNSDSPVNQKAYVGANLGVGFRYFPIRWLGIEIKPFTSFNLYPLDVAQLSSSLQSIEANYTLKDSFFHYGLYASIIFAKRKKIF